MGIRCVQGLLVGAPPSILWTPFIFYVPPFRRDYHVIVSGAWFGPAQELLSRWSSTCTSVFIERTALLGMKSALHQCHPS